MKQEGLAFFTDIHLTIIGLIIFVTFFIGVLIWVNRKSAGPLYAKLAEMPLTEGKENGK